jgi:RNA polymerase sigma factor (sigma-70 family)
MAPPIQSSVRKFTTQQRIAQADEDIALLAQVVRKDMRAFEALYRNYHRRLTRFLERITRQPHLIEEILDDTMLVVWLQAQTYDRSCRVSTWIFSIAYNKAMKAVRRAGRPLQALPDIESVATNNGPEAESIERESRHRMQQLLALLPPEQCAVVELTYFHGYSYTEIARIVDCPVGTVKTRMFHARRKLGSMLTARPEQ